MNLIIQDLINSFESDCRNSKDRYDQFISYLYVTFEKKIKFAKSPTLKDKYKQIQKNSLQYIVANKREIINKLK
jgi:hypothetical protein